MADMKVELIDRMGSDLSVVNAARVSFDKESFFKCPNETEEEPHEHGHQGADHWCETCDLGKDEAAWEMWDDDKKLINYLAKHNHWSPFSHAFVSFRIKAPIFVARQLAKHQVGLAWNEVSRRYVDSEPEFYVPDTWRKRAENVKQGSSEEVVGNSPAYRREYEQLLIEVNELYLDLIYDGICPEQARMVLPQSMMTEWIWSGSLYAFSRVCKLRLDSHTQKETQIVAEDIARYMQAFFPVSWKALNG